MTEARRLGRILVWSTYEDAAQAKSEAATIDCKLTNRITSWPTSAQAAAHMSAGSGGGGGYQAPAVNFDGATFLNIDELFGVVDGPKGILSYWAKDLILNADDGVSGAKILSNDNGNFITLGRSGGSTPPCTLGFYLTNADYSAQWDIDTDDPVLPAGEWYHVLIAWDVGFNPGSRRAAIYVNDVLKPHSTSFSETGDDTMLVHYAGIPTAWGSDFPYFNAAKGYCADGYVNYTDTIVEAGDTILEVNRRKFITADGKPANPTGFPANGCMVFSGDASSFADNDLGSGGAFEVLKMFTCGDGAGPGPIPCVGLRAGDVVRMVRNQNSGNVSSDFESVVTVNDQIQQTSEVDYTGTVTKVTVPGVLTNAPSSPSD